MAYSLKGIWARRLIVMSCTVLAAGLNGCARDIPRDVQLPSEEARRSFGGVGVISVGYQPTVEFATTRGTAAGVAQGAAEGGGAIASSLLRGASCSGMGCAFVVVMIPGLVVGGAVVGAVHGGLTAVPEETATSVEESLRAALRAEAPNPAILRQVVEIAAEERVESVRNITAPGERPDNAGLRVKGIDTLLEVGVVDVGFAGIGGSDPKLTLFLTARARLMALSGGAEIYARETIAYQSAPRKFSEWKADEAKPLREALSDAYAQVAQQVVDEVFLLVR